MISRLKIRAVQIDLARQLEPIKKIYSFLDFAADYHYNTLFLYLEARIRTLSFPFPSPDQSYTLTEIESIVKYAHKKKLEVVPVIPNLGHTEQFLKYPRMQHISELKPGSKKRFVAGHFMVCPSMEETYEFFRRYYREISVVFPSRYLHVGNDESWELGCCPICEKRAEKEGLSGIFTRHLLRTHQMVVKELGKKMLMWDDMFELCPETLGAIPKDIILCCWLYDNVFDKPFSHFLNRRREDLLAKYRRLGFQYIICPGEETTNNVISFSRYASSYHPLGALLTTWEHSGDFLYRYLPNIAFAGRLWSGKNKEDVPACFEETLREFFRVRDKRFISALKTFCSRRAWPESNKPQDFLRGTVSQFEEERRNETALLINVFQPFVKRVRKGLPRTSLEDILFALERESLQHRLRSTIPQIQTKNFLPSLKRTVQIASGLSERLEKRWQKLRPGIKPNYASKFFRDLVDNLNTFLAPEEKRSLNRGLLNLYCFLPDRYSLSWTRALLKFGAGGKWQEVYAGVIKPYFDEEPFYQITLPVDINKEPVTLKLEVWGYGGQGFRFVEINTRKYRYIPDSIAHTEGRIVDGQHLLHDDYRWTYFGEPDVFTTFHTIGAKDKKHSLELRLTRLCNSNS